MRTRTLLATTLVLAATALWAGPAWAFDEYDLDFRGIEGENEFEPDDRLGTASGIDDHVINIEDCEAYKGESITIYWGLSSEPLVAGEYAIKRAAPGQTCDGDALDTLESVVAGECPEVLYTGDIGGTEEFSVEMNDILNYAPDEGGVDCLIGDEFTTRIYVFIDWGDGLEFDTDSFEFTVDLDPPSAPTDVEALAGENSIRVSWTDDVNTEGAGTEYRVYYRVNYPITDVEDADGHQRSGEDAESLTITGLQTNAVYYFRVVAIDDNENESDLSANADVYATTIPATDFWENYNDAGGKAEGGFCFIATAAYGTELESHVHWLRRFRDQVLMPTAAGRAFVDWYYENSPPLALAIRDQPVLAAIVRVALAPLVFAAWFLLGLGLAGKLAVLATGWAAIRLVRELARRRYATGAPEMRSLAPARPTPGARWLRAPAARLMVAALAAATLMGAWSAPAKAGLQVDDLFTGDSPQSVLFELKFGPYKPDIDSEFSGAKPYEDIFGSSSFLMSSIQVEYEFFQDWGVLSTGVGIGFGTTEGDSLMADGSKGLESTSLYLMPLNASLTYHLDVMAKEWSVPLVPFVRAGFDYVIWWTTDGLGDLSDWKADAGDSARVGYGGTWGWHVSGGIKLLLDIMAPTMARTFDIEVGVNNSYLFAEYMYLRADNFGAKDGLRVGDGTFMFGLAFEI